MLKQTLVWLCGAALCAALLCTGCQTNNSTLPAPAPVVPSQKQEKPLSDTADASPAPVSQHPLQDAVVNLLEREPHLFPTGTRLKSIKLEEGVATLDFSSEFNGLANMGESGESLAQQKLQATLAKFPNVEKMRVTVEGHSFDSQATDWNTPFPVGKKGHIPLDAKTGGMGDESHGDRP